jgi:hypothetical protein
MSDNKIYQRIKSIKNKELLMLIPIIILVCILTFYPHINYPYLLHVDEWFHIARAKQVVLNTSFDWYTAETFNLGMERAWHSLLASIEFLFKPSITQWSYLPTILHVLAVLSVYFFVSKLFSKNEALIASLLIALIPSNVSMGGPVFLIPINLSLIFIPIALVFTFRLIKIKTRYNYLLLILINTFLLYAHPPTAMVLLTILIIYYLLNVLSKDIESKKQAKLLLITIIVSLLFSIPNYLPVLQERGLQSLTFNFWVYLQGIPFLIGILPTIFFIIGFFFLIKTRKNETWSLIITSIILLVNIIIFTAFGSTVIFPYQRTHIPLFLLMSIIASRGFIKLLELRKPHKTTGLIILVICLVATTSMAIERNVNTTYYHIIDDNDYNNFMWIKENTPKNSTILSDPWKSRALAPIAERSIYAVIPFGPDIKQMTLVHNAHNFLDKNCTNTTFLIENNIKIVYSTCKCHNPNLITLRENIYSLRYMDID